MTTAMRSPHSAAFTHPTTRVVSCGLTAVLLLATGCANMNHTQKGMAMGGGAGTVAGAVIGHQFGHAGMGAILGGLAGTTTGAVAGNMQDEADRRDAWARQASYERSQRRRAQRAATNLDVIEMVGSGTSDRLIISTINDRGGIFDLSPQGVITLQKYGVSENVILSMQRNNMSP